MRIERPQKNFVAQNGDTAIHAAAARPNIRRQRALILPDRPAGARVQRVSAIILTCSVQHAIDNQRRRLEFSSGHGLICPLRHQRMRVRSINLFQRAESMTRIVAGISKPVLRLLGGVEQPLRRDLRPDRAAEKSAHH